MAFGSFQSAGPNRAMSEINMVPLIDVVLVLLVLFILAAPMATQSIKVSLPKTATVAQDTEPWTIDLQLQQDGLVLNDSGMPLNIDSLGLSDDSKPGQQPTLRIFSDQDTRYEYLANLVVNLRQRGFQKISLMTKAQ